MNKCIVTAAALVCALVASGASAATWTFGADAEEFDNKANQSAAGNGELAIEGTFDQVYLDSDSPLFGKNVQGGITMTASATTTNANGDVVAADPFMDSKSGGRIAGLGVCSTGFEQKTDNYGGESQCSTHYTANGGTGVKKAGDDNLVSPEVLKLLFDHEVFIDALTVRNASHYLVDGFIMISTDGTFDVNTDKYTMEKGIVDLKGLGSSTMFWFTSFNDNIPKPEIYLETLTASKVPVPAALPLLLAGLGGLGWVGRRRKKA